MEQASNVGDNPNCDKSSAKLTVSPRHCNSVRDVTAVLIADKPARLYRWCKHFKHLNFNERRITPSPSITAEFQSSPAYAVSCNLPSEDEVTDAIQRLRNNKACGEDKTLAPWLHEVIVQALREEAVPDDWGSGILVPVHSNGDKTRCANYRGISLIDVSAKIFAIFLLRRFQTVRESKTWPNEAGFRAGRGSADHIFTLRRILEFRDSY
ncbi:unnamed protein product [Dibothriocephalus latus]|uniref:Reverse transcriptase domain-containing protein n=1 Tax=Dibothriocephalus latus TaxID=60516 RepID=A0A3P6T257_DIBLA|nr:unnamed protein product [Dibothriocephalus latus]